MENHPIPQDVTGFKFRLIGSITLKQFLYLLFFGVFCVVAFILPISIIFRIPFVMFFAALGAAFAFVPVEGRPLDIMLTHFLKALPSENRYIYHKKGANFFAYEFLKTTNHPHPTPQQTQESEQQRKSMLISQLRNSSYRPDAQEIDFMKNIKSFFEDTAYTKNTVITPIAQVAAPTPVAHPAQVVLPQTQTAQPASDYAKSLGEQAIALQHQIERAEIEEKSAKNQSDLERQIKDLQTQLDTILSQRDTLEKKMLSYEKESVQKNVYTPSVQNADAPPQEEKVTQSARIVSSKESQLAAGFPSLPDVPNVALGIVKDPRNKVLQNILVEIVDKDGVPVRAFKTNALGQFRAATPLPNGTYKVFFEDPKKEHDFDTIEVTLSGEIFQPLEVFSIDQREKLRRELFQN